MKRFVKRFLLRLKIRPNLQSSQRSIRISPLLLKKSRNGKTLIVKKKNLEDLLQDPSLDKELKDMAQEDLQRIHERLPEMLHEIQVLLLPKDVDDDRNAIIEIRAGTGGEEAALFGANLLRMYQRYAELQGWKFELMHESDTGLGGIKEATATISGKGVFAKLKFESGVHRVQRVPETEAAGRIHTSAATVAVLPEAEEVDIHIEEKDLRIDVFRSSGPRRVG